MEHEIELDMKDGGEEEEDRKSYSRRSTAEVRRHSHHLTSSPPPPPPPSKKTAAALTTTTSWSLLRQCSCCEKNLQRNSYYNCIATAAPKRGYYECVGCGGCICKNCRGPPKVTPNGAGSSKRRSLTLPPKCHECQVKESVILEPEELLKLDRKELLDQLRILHYQRDPFQSWDKEWLVKQILTRFKVHTNWNPNEKPPTNQEKKSVNSRPKLRRLCDQSGGVNKLVETAAETHSGNWQTETLTEVHNVKDSEEDIRNKKTITTSAEIRPLLDGHQHPNKITEPEPETQQQRQRRILIPVHLSQIERSATIEKMSAAELSAILDRHGLRPEAEVEKHRLAYAVLCLWNAAKTVSSGDATFEQKRQLAEEAASRHRTVGHPHSSATSPPSPSISLSDLSLASQVEQLSVAQLRSILIQHAINPQLYKEPYELYFAVMHLWCNIKEREKEMEKSRLKYQHNVTDYFSVDKKEKLTANNNQLRMTSSSMGGGVKWMSDGHHHHHQATGWSNRVAPLAIQDEIGFIDAD